MGTVSRFVFLALAPLVFSGTAAPPIEKCFPPPKLVCTNYQQATGCHLTRPLPTVKGCPNGKKLLHVVDHAKTHQAPVRRPSSATVAAAPYVRPFATRDVGDLAVTCDSPTFIVSRNSDDDDANGLVDANQDLPLAGQPALEDNLRKFDFALKGAETVFISPVKTIPGDQIVVGKGQRVRAFESDRVTPFAFGERKVPVTMYLEGQTASKTIGDLAFEYEYRAGGTNICKPKRTVAVGTVADAAAKATAGPDTAASFSARAAIGIGKSLALDGSAAPAGLVTPEWSYDGDAHLTTPNAFASTLLAGYAPTPAARIGKDLVHLKLMCVNCTPKPQLVEATTPLSLDPFNPTNPPDVVTGAPDANGRASFKIVGKSYIAHVKPPAFLPNDGYDPGGFGTNGHDHTIETATAADYITLTKETNQQFDEDPLTKPAGNPALDRRDGKAGQYRIYSSETVSFGCVKQADKWKVLDFTWHAAKEESDAGLERLPPKNTAAIPSEPKFYPVPWQRQQYLRQIGGAGGVKQGAFDEVGFQYGVKGRPHKLAETYLRLMVEGRHHKDANGKDRLYAYASHFIGGRAYCDAGTPKLSVNISGTAFPSHLLFVNGKPLKKLPQGNYDQLWRPELTPLVNTGGFVKFREPFPIDV
jgi:hypothetical protein